MTLIKVIKKDGSKEDFDPEKILEACKKAGASDSVSKLIVKEVIGKLFVVRSSDLRSTIYKTLRKIDKKSANNYRKHHVQEPVSYVS